MFRIEETTVNGDALRSELAVPEAGGCAIFEGWVRNSNEGRAVDRLDYEAYKVLAEREGERILAEAVERFGVERCLCVHRVGELAIGDMAVWVGVSAPHRGAAFSACRYIIDEVKSRVPIWKKEHYTTGDTEWVNCAQCAGHGHALESSLYARQTRLPEVGSDGQEKLKGSGVLVVGAGGLGSAALSYLAGAGVGRLGICEADRLEASNLHRQPLYEFGDVGEDKALLARRRLATLNPFVKIEIHPESLTHANADRLLEPYDVVVDCTDDFNTKLAINDAAQRAGKPAVFASIYQYDGQLQVMQPSSSSACLRCLWPEAPSPLDTGTCEQAGVLGAVPGVFGAMQAMETLKLLLGLPGLAPDELGLVDLMSMEMRKLRITRNPDCAGADGCVRTSAGPELEIDYWSMPAQARGGLVLVDIREAEETLASPLPASDVVTLPLSGINVDSPPLDRERQYALCCASGQRSRWLADALHARGFAGVRSVAGGLSAAHQGK
ncbi:MAG: ThiF family adenylyltransferase [Pseudomonadota bacterium]